MSAAMSSFRSEYIYVYAHHIASIRSLAQPTLACKLTQYMRNYGKTELSIGASCGAIWNWETGKNLPRTRRAVSMMAFIAMRWFAICRFDDHKNVETYLYIFGVLGVRCVFVFAMFLSYGLRTKRRNITSANIFIYKDDFQVTHLLYNIMAKHS